jgi:hypothetical protein
MKRLIYSSNTDTSEYTPEQVEYLLEVQMEVCQIDETTFDSLSNDLLEWDSIVALGFDFIRLGEWQWDGVSDYISPLSIPTEQISHGWAGWPTTIVTNKAEKVNNDN